jgi:hypothetical protein
MLLTLFGGGGSVDSWKSRQILLTVGRFGPEIKKSGLSKQEVRVWAHTASY